MKYIYDKYYSEYEIDLSFDKYIVFLHLASRFLTLFSKILHRYMDCMQNYKVLTNNFENQIKYFFLSCYGIQCIFWDISWQLNIWTVGFISSTMQYNVNTVLIKCSAKKIFLIKPTGEIIFDLAIPDSGFILYPILKFFI